MLVKKGDLKQLELDLLAAVEKFMVMTEQVDGNDSQRDLAELKIELEEKVQAVVEAVKEQPGVFVGKV